MMWQVRLYVDRVLCWNVGGGGAQPGGHRQILCITSWTWRRRGETLYKSAHVCDVVCIRFVVPQEYSFGGGKGWISHTSHIEYIYTALTKSRCICRRNWWGRTIAAKSTMPTLKRRISSKPWPNTPYPLPQREKLRCTPHMICHTQPYRAI